MAKILQYYYGVRAIRDGHEHTIYLYADDIRVENGDLLLLRS